jgi:SSS family transporter
MTALTLAATALAWPDIAIVVGAIAVLLLIAFWTGRRESDTRDFFLGGRRVPMLIAALSLVATEVSAVTITNVPGTTATEDLRYLQFFLGSAASKVFVAFLFLPVFYRHDCTSIYEFLRHRFGPPSQIAGSAFFFVTRLLASGVRLLAACLAISLITGWPLWAALGLFTVASIAFIGFGGVKAVVWTGAYQAMVFLGAGLVVLGWLYTQIPGGLDHVWNVAGQAGRLRLLDFSSSLSTPTNFWAGTANAFFIGLVVFGADQEMVQRLLTVRTRRASQQAVLTSIGAALPVTLLYTLMGTLLFVFLSGVEPGALNLAPKLIFPHCISTYLPVGLKGLVLAAILLASIDSPLASLSSSFVTDLYRPLIAPRATQRHYLRVGRAGVVGAGVLLVLVAWACNGADNLLWLAFQIVSITGGSLLGVFLVGLLTRRGSNKANLIAMVANAVLMAVLTALATQGPIGLKVLLGLSAGPVPVGEKAILPLGWTWVVVIGTLVTFGLAYGLSFLRPFRPQPAAIESRDQQGQPVG